MDMQIDKLCPFNVRRVLLIASQYDAFLLEEDGSLEDLIGLLYKERDVGYIPQFFRASDENDSWNKIRTHNIDLIIYCIRNPKKQPKDYVTKIKLAYPSLPITFLLYHQLEQVPSTISDDWDPSLDIFLWSGDSRIIASIIQYIEDKNNVQEDSKLLTIPIILFVEDSIKYYSSYLNTLYDTLWSETKKLYEDDTSLSEKIFKQKTRTKVLLAKNFEQADSILQSFHSHIIGIITDMQYPIEEGNCDITGLTLMNRVWEYDTNMPIVLQSSTVCSASCIKEHHVICIQKKSKTLLKEIRNTLTTYFGFGDLLFKDENNNISSRIPSIRSFTEVFDSLDLQSLDKKIHSGELARWFLVHSEYEMASYVHKIEKKDPLTKKAWSKLKHKLEQQISKENRGSIVNYSRKFPLEEWTIGKIGGGSIGGKARGLSFFNKILVYEYPFHSFPDIHLYIPQSIILGTDVFDDFVRINKLDYIYDSDLSDQQISRIFMQASLPPTVLGDIRNIVLHLHEPLVIRSSSLLEDALYHPFAGIYFTKMVPNNEISFDLRFTQLCNAIKLVYASTFSKQARTYMETTGHIVEQEKMGVIIQKCIGSRKGDLYYPEGSGVLRSYNYYPFRHAQPEDGIMQLAMGLGKTIVDGETSLQFSPKYPNIIPQLSSVDSSLQTTQKKFWALNLKPYHRSFSVEENEFLTLLPINKGLESRSFEPIASTYSNSQDRLFNGMYRNGPKVITFHQLLNQKYSSFVPCIRKLLEICENAMSAAVEIECAFSIDPITKLIHFGFLQVRPMMKFEHSVSINLDTLSKKTSFCYTSNALGNGEIDTLKYIVLVEPEKFDLSKTKEIVLEIDQINKYFSDINSSYILMGPGRWGTSDPWLGIPVQWNHISKIGTFVEYDLPSLHIDPSQGSHFFQNITSLHIAYLTISHDNPKHFVDWDWIKNQQKIIEKEYISVYSFDNPLCIKVDGRKSIGVIEKA